MHDLNLLGVRALTQAGLIDRKLDWRAEIIKVYWTDIRQGGHRNAHAQCEQGVYEIRLHIQPSLLAWLYCSNRDVRLFCAFKIYSTTR